MSWWSRFWKKLLGKWKGTGNIRSPQHDDDAWISGVTDDDPRLHAYCPDLELFYDKPPDQGRSNACTGFATTHILQFFFYQHTGDLLDFSQLFSWHTAKLRHGYHDKNYGVYFRYNFDELIKTGISDYDSLPWNKNNFLRSPTFNSWAVAMEMRNLLIRRGVRVYKAQTNDALDMLDKEIPVAIGCRTSKQFWKGSYVDDPTHTDGQGHAMVAMKKVHRDGKIWIKCANSHKDWYKYLSEDYFRANVYECYYLLPREWVRNYERV